MTAFAHSALLLLCTLGLGSAQTVAAGASSSAAVDGATSGATSVTTSPVIVYADASSSASIQYTATEVVGITIYSTVGQTYTATSDGSEASQTSSSSGTTSLVPIASSSASSDTGKKIGIGVGVGVGVPLLLACLALGVFLFKRRGQAHASPAMDDEEDPFSANINKYHTTNAAANF